MNGRLREPKESIHDATVVFIHHFGGSRATSRKHQDLVLSAGFRASAFDLSGNVIPSWKGLWPKDVHGFDRGMIERWARELEIVLDSLAGTKILYSFSFPSACVAALLGARPRADVRGWICDGGPFLDIWQCMWNLFTYAERTPNGLKRLGLTTISYWMAGGPDYVRRVRRWTSRLDPALPILSIRSGADVLVPPPAIDRFFEAAPKKNFSTLLLPNAAHLKGLEADPQVYRARVVDFLRAAAVG